MASSSSLHSANGRAVPQPTVWMRAALDDAAPAVAAPLGCDVAVVGGGLAGLSTALHLKILAPHLDVVLLEAGRIGYGQSGLNSGQAAPRIGPAIEAQVAALGRAAAIAAHAYSVQAIEFAAALVNRHHIDCDLEATSQWEVSLTDRDAAKLERRSSLYRALGFDVPLVDSSAVRSALPSSTRIRNAIAFPAYRLNPGRLCVGLKRVAQQAGVRVFEHSRAELSPVLAVAGFDVRADRVVLAVDGGIAALKLSRSTVFPVSAFAAVTRPLRPEERAAIGWAEGQGLYDARPLFNFLRPLADGRLLIGGNYHYAHSGRISGKDVTRSASRLMTQLENFFPALKGLAAERAWGGVLGCTLNEWPVVAPLDDARCWWHLGGWNGHGVALAIAGGHELATVLADPASDAAVSLPAPCRQRATAGIPAAALRVLLPAYLGWLRRQSRLPS